MGLDVYLSKYSDYAKSKANEEAYDKYSTELWDKLEAIDNDPTEKAKNQVREKLQARATELGLGEWGEDITYREKIELDSVLHPDHYFKIGYFRSSYNGSGLNNILRDLGIPDLYDIFQPNDEYEFVPDWNYALTMVQESIEMVKKDKGYRIETIAANMFDPDNVPTSPAAAMEKFNEQLARVSPKNKDFTWYSNRDGHFYMDKKGQEVHGLIPGKDMFNKPCTFVVYKLKDGNKYILQSLEVVKETIEYVLAQDNPQAFYLRWSG